MIVEIKNGTNDGIWHRLSLQISDNHKQIRVEVSHFDKIHIFY